EPGLFLLRSLDDDETYKKKRLRRRALRQAWILRRSYEGHLVPDEPSSPGENVRVLPIPHVRVAEEQIVNPVNRTKRLYQDDPLDSRRGSNIDKALVQSIDDLHHCAELRELGTAIFLDRPLGGCKNLTEPDGTILFSYVAFSHSVAYARLHEIHLLLGLPS